jgi:hypothetical protein
MNVRRTDQERENFIPVRLPSFEVLHSLIQEGLKRPMQEEARGIEAFVTQDCGQRVANRPPVAYPFNPVPMRRNFYPRPPQDISAYGSYSHALHAHIQTIVRQMSPERATFLHSESKIIAGFLGRVESFVEDEAIVSLFNQKTGDRLEAECEIETLRQNGIGEGDEFRCDVVQNDSGTSVRLYRLKPKQIDPERVAAIWEEVKDLNL